MCFVVFGDVSILRLTLSVDVFIFDRPLFTTQKHFAFSSVTIVSDFNHNEPAFLPMIFSISICGQALFATKVMVILSLALSVFNVKHEIKMIVYRRSFEISEDLVRSP